MTPHEEQLSNMMAVVASVERERDGWRMDAISASDDRDTWRQKAIELGLEASQAEALCQQYREALEKIVLIECVDDLHHAEDALCNLPSTPTTALNNAIAEELEQVAEGYMVYDPIDSTKLMQYYGSHIRGVLRNRAKELREDK